MFVVNIWTQKYGEYKVVHINTFCTMTDSIWVKFRVKIQNFTKFSRKFWVYCNCNCKKSFYTWSLILTVLKGCYMYITHAAEQGFPLKSYHFMGPDTQGNFRFFRKLAVWSGLYLLTRVCKTLSMTDVFSNHMDLEVQ